MIDLKAANMLFGATLRSPHAAARIRAIDLDAVYARADLVLDTVNSSRGRPTRPRQVLRLGAGWSA